MHGLFSRSAGTLLAAAVLAACTLSVSTPAAAGDLEGTWTGGGTVTFSSGAKERASCRVTYRRISGTVYEAKGSCATKSGKISQVASLSRSGDGRYAGSFQNMEYNIDGAIRVQVRGTSQTMSLSAAGGGSGRFQLSRR